MASANRFIFLVLFLGLIPFSCRPEYPYYEIRDYSISTFADQNLTKPVAEFGSKDSVFIKLLFECNFIAAAQTSFNNACLATRKPLNGEYGPKVKFSGLSFTSNRSFNGQPAGTELSGILNYKFNIWQGPEKLIDALNDRSPAGYPETEGYEGLYMDEHPSDTLVHRFTLRLLLEDGGALTASTDMRFR
jgi:hypothetical protein